MLRVTEQDRVRANTADQINRKIDRQIDENVRFEGEWDIERVLELMASSFSLTGIALGLTINGRWFLVPTVVLSFLFMHAVQGWCPPIPVLRRLGVRTREEIDRELCALKAVVGGTAAGFAL